MNRPRAHTALARSTAARSRSRGGILRKLLIGFGALAALGVVVQAIVLTTTTPEERAEARKQSEARRHKSLTETVGFKSLAWRVNQLGVVSIDFAANNSNPFAVKDLEVTCFLFATSGTKVGELSQRWLDVVPANRSVTVRGFVLGRAPGQAASADCALTHARQ
jgi:hypothetical protein